MSRAVLLEQVRLALRSIRAQWLRTLLTITIIGTGIMALMSMITATEALRSSLIEQFVGLGAGTLQIDQKQERGAFGGRRISDSTPIRFDEAMALKKQTSANTATAVSARGTMMGRLSREGKETDPNVLVVGGDEGFIPMSGYNLLAGRNFTAEEVRRNAPLVILGSGRRPPPAIILYMTPPIAPTTDLRSAPNTGACGVPWGACWVPPGGWVGPWGYPVGGILGILPSSYTGECPGR